MPEHIDLVCPCFFNHKNPIRYEDVCTIDLDIDIQYQEHILITIIHKFITNFVNYIGIY